jgi:hypothetical protein
LGVDPEPNSYITVPEEIYNDCLKPVCKTLEDEKLDKYINDAILFILFPYPEGHITAGYDIRAIEKMKPKAIFVGYGPCGCSGSSNLINLLDNNHNCYRNIKEPQKIIKIQDDEYNLVSSLTLKEGTGTGFLGKTIRNVAYIRSDLVKNPIIPSYDNIMIESNHPKEYTGLLTMMDMMFGLMSP